MGRKHNSLPALENPGTQIPTAYTGSQQANQGDSGLASPAVSSGNATPRSAIMDTSGTNFSGSHTDIKTPRTPVAFAMPALPLNGSSGQAKERPVDAQRLLIWQLSHFTESVSEIASATVQRDQANVAIDRKAQEYSRWQSHGGDFRSLIEEQAKEVKWRKATATKLEKKLKTLEEVKVNTVKDMASTILTVGPSQPTSRLNDESDKFKSLQGDVRELRAELKSSTSSSRSNNDEHRWIRLETDMHGLRTSIEGAVAQSSRWKSVDAELLALKKQIGKVEERVTSRHEQVTKHNDSVAAQDINAIRAEMGSLRAQLETLSSTKSDIGDLQQKTNTLSRQQSLLGDEIAREHDTTPGLLQQSKLDKVQFAELRDSYSRHNQSLGDLSQNIVRQTNQLTALESSRETVSKDISALTLEFKGDLTAVKGSLDGLKTEQATKNDSVGKEVERLDKALAALQEDTNEAKKLLQTTIDLVNSNHTKIEEQLSSQSARPTSQQHSGLHSPEWLKERNMNELSTSNELNSSAENPAQKSDLLDDYNGRLIACEAVLGNLQSRFDNLSTADLARSMVHQMQTMYPYPASVFQQLDAVARTTKTTTQQMAQIAVGLGNVSRQVDGLAASAPSGPAKSRPPTPSSGRPVEKDTDAQLDGKLLALSKELQGKFDTEYHELEALKQRQESSDKRVSDISGLIDTAKSRYEEIVGDIRTEISKVREFAASKAAKTEVEAMEKTLNDKIADARGRIIEREDAVIDEMVILRGQLSEVENHTGITFKTRGKITSAEEEVSDVPIVVANGKALATKAAEAKGEIEAAEANGEFKGSSDDEEDKKEEDENEEEEEEEDDDDDDLPLARNSRTAAKRRRVSDDSDIEALPKKQVRG
ncbi:hypothetical protein MMC13_006966 [Lambiella insularis]|nr:hypothetical protein [Lambiella insularis]